jgi:hypothetical protein
MQLRALRNVIEDPKQFRTEAVLRREVRLAAKRLVDIQALGEKDAPRVFQPEDNEHKLMPIQLSEHEQNIQKKFK